MRRRVEMEGRREADADGLTLHLHLPKDTYWAGEGGEATITLRNDSTEPVALGGSTRFGWGGVLLLDERGQFPTPWPWAPAVRGGGPPRETIVGPGEEARATRCFQVPPAEQAAGHTYTLHARVRFIHPPPQDGRYTNWADLAASSPLRVVPPGPAQFLQARLEADRAGWRLQVADGAGQTPTAPLWGEAEAMAYRLASGGPLPLRADGRWAQGWTDYVQATQSAITVRVWVAAPGFVTVAAEQTIPPPPLRRVSVPPKADQAAIARACGPWSPSFGARPDHAQIECAARLVAGQEAVGQRTGFAMLRVAWREAAVNLGVDLAVGPAPHDAVWLVELDNASAVGTVVVLDAETGAPLLLLEPQSVP